jgi:hypothetical protein
MGTIPVQHRDAYKLACGCPGGAAGCVLKGLEVLCIIHCIYTALAHLIFNSISIEFVLFFFSLKNIFYSSALIHIWDGGEFLYYKSFFSLSVMFVHTHPQRRRYVLKHAVGDIYRNSVGCVETHKDKTIQPTKERTSLLYKKIMS